MFAKNRKAVALLCFLILSPGDHPRNRLARLLWSGSAERKAMASLRVALFAIRNLVGPAILCASRRTVAFRHTDAITIDLNEFYDLIRASLHHSKTDRSEDIAKLQRAVDLYRGDLLSGVALPENLLFHAWLLEQRARHRELAIEALSRLAEYYLEQNRLSDAITATRRILTLDPLREETHRL
ncbi:MAG: hypothetical protein HY327_03690 [Chloroflexi bacterium]|nr:hypothetical protein [Chloroflexota bacterium]